MSFVQITEDTYRRSAFLVPKHEDFGDHVYTFNVDDLLLDNLRSPWVNAPTHYILITAFCCSTLLARYLDQITHCLVIKEPALVAQLGFISLRNNRERGREWNVERSELTRLGLSLLGRPFEGTKTIIVKPSDLGNCIALKFLNHDSRTKLVLLSVPLRIFILSVLKLPSRRQWVRDRFNFWSKLQKRFPLLASMPVRKLNDAQRSAVLWLLTNAFWLEARTSQYKGRVLPVDGEQVAVNPVKTLTEILSFLEIECYGTMIEDIATSSVSAKHSKRPSAPYDKATRAEDIMEWERLYGAEATSAIDWAAPLAAALELGTINSFIAGLRHER